MKLKWEKEKNVKWVDWDDVFCGRAFQMKCLNAFAARIDENYFGVIELGYKVFVGVCSK